MQNCWILYKTLKSPEDPTYDLLKFRREVVNTYLSKYRSPCTSHKGGRQRIVGNALKRKPVPAEIRFDRSGHFSSDCLTTKKCAECNKNTRKWCQKCGKGLHLHCFNKFHDFEWYWSMQLWEQTQLTYFSYHFEKKTPSAYYNVKQILNRFFVHFYAS